MKNRKKLTILHSNDMHGDFMAEQVDNTLIGGVSMLSGYINKVRQEEKNVIYTISGDMFLGSLIDSEYKGLSTIEIMNMLAPDVVTLGNHEVDYGIAHLLFLEKCARFPIINANLYLNSNHIRLFRSHYIKEIDGMKILFIGILTEEVLAQARQEQIIGSFVDVREAAVEVGKICDAYNAIDIDFTVLLTHIGFEEDKKLAALLREEWGVDIIIGGHSHTKLDEPEVVNGIPIVQAATGTDQIGRFDIIVDTDNNCIDSYEWQLVPINSEHCPRDEDLERIIRYYNDSTHEKYSRYLTRFERQFTHPCRNRETEVGRLFADILRDSLGLDLMLVGSGSLRNPMMGPIVDYRCLVEMYPYCDEVYRFTIDGAQLKKAICHIFREEVFDRIRTEFYQFSRGIRIVVSESERKVKEIHFNGEEIDDRKLFQVGMSRYHFMNSDKFIGLSHKEIKKYKDYRVIASKDTDILEEYFCNQELVKCPSDERWITVE